MKARREHPHSKSRPFDPKNPSARWGMRAHVRSSDLRVRNTIGFGETSSFRLVVRLCRYRARRGMGQASCHVKRSLCTGRVLNDSESVSQVASLMTCRIALFTLHNRGAAKQHCLCCVSAHARGCAQLRTSSVCHATTLLARRAFTNGGESCSFSGRRIRVDAIAAALTGEICDVCDPRKGR